MSPGALRSEAPLRSRVIRHCGQSDTIPSGDAAGSLRCFTPRNDEMPRTRPSPSIGLFGINRIDRAAPRTVEFFKQLLRRRDAARQTAIQHVEVACLVLAVAVETPAPRHAGAGELENIRCDRKDGAAANDGGKTLSRYVVAKFLAIRGAPVLDQMPCRIERRIVIENADPKRRQRQ